MKHKINVIVEGEADMPQDEMIRVAIKQLNEALQRYYSCDTIKEAINLTIKT